MNRFAVFSLILIFSSGCAKIRHMQELLTLKSYSDNQEIQHRYVKEQDRKFEELLKVVKGSQLEKFSNQKTFIRKFGNPIFIKEVEKDGRQLEQWLYRYAKRYFDSEKVYVYFDRSRKLIDWRYEEPIRKRGEPESE